MKRIIIVGKGGSGKDYLRKIFESFGFVYCRSYTTRPIREGEENGKDYFFIEDKDIPKKEDLYESVYFNNWFYGTPKSNIYVLQRKSKNFWGCKGRDLSVKRKIILLLLLNFRPIAEMDDPGLPHPDYALCTNIQNPGQARGFDTYSQHQ